MESSKNKTIKNSLYIEGLKKGLPIGIGYYAVSFAFGAMCVKGGISPLIATIMSATNLTSAGQLAGASIMIEYGSLIEIALVVTIINLRYLLMSFSLSQKIDEKQTLLDRFLISFSLTDEIYAIAITEKKAVTRKLAMGLLTLPFIGWVVGTLCGSLLAGVLPQNLLNALSIALYVMFFAIVLPECRNSYKVSIVVIIAITISCCLEYIPVFSVLGFGFKTLISTIISSVFGALVFPIKKENSSSEVEHE